MFEWSDKIGPRGRKPWLLLIKDDKVYLFQGQTIPGVVAVVGHDFTLAGKWSETVYRLKLADGVRVIAGRDGWETGRFTEGLGEALGRKTPDTWTEVAEYLGVSVPAVREFLSGWRPEAVRRLDAVDEALESVEASGTEGTDARIITVKFGAPSSRQMAEGYWVTPKPIHEIEGAEVYLLDPSKGWVDGNVAVRGVNGRVLSVTRSRGYHGGYVAVKVAIAE